MCWTAVGLAPGRAAFNSVCRWNFARWACVRTCVQRPDMFYLPVAVADQWISVVAGAGPMRADACAMMTIRDEAQITDALACRAGRDGQGRNAASIAGSHGTGRLWIAATTTKRYDHQTPFDRSAVLSSCCRSTPPFGPCPTPLPIYSRTVRTSSVCRLAATVTCLVIASVRCSPDVATTTQATTTQC